MLILTVNGRVSEIKATKNKYKTGTSHMIIKVDVVGGMTEAFEVLDCPFAGFCYETDHCSISG